MTSSDPLSSNPRKMIGVDGIDYIQHALRFVLVDTGGALVQIFQWEDEEEDEPLKIIVRCKYGVSNIDLESETKHYRAFIKDAQKIQRETESGVRGKLVKALEKIEEREASPKRGQSELDQDTIAFQKDAINYLVEKMPKKKNEVNISSLEKGEWFLAYLVLSW
eukprot:g10294.t1